MRGILNLPPARTSQIAAEQRLQHQHQRILLASLELLPEDVSCHRPHLRNWYPHSSLPCRRNKSPVVAIPPVVIIPSAPRDLRSWVRATQSAARQFPPQPRPSPG